MAETPKKYVVETFGCRVNQADSEGIRAQLESEHLGPAASFSEADVVVINSCTVTHRSDADIRKMVHRIQRANPAAEVIVTGCYAQRDPDALSDLGAAVVGNSDVHQIGSLVRLGTKRPGREPLVVRTAFDALDPADLPPVDPVAAVHDRTRPFVKIQDGCDAACTYCVIPAVRGPARSASFESVVQAAVQLIEAGYFEIVLAGVHLGTYGEKLEGRPDLASVVEAVAALPGLGRLRLSCIEPMAFPMRLAELVVEGAPIAPHFHLPLQSGCDRILKRMARPYRTAEFFGVVDQLRGMIDNVCIGTDVIVGFPGETDEDFEDTLAAIEGSALSYLHVFSYSDRPGVPSTRLKDKVDPKAIKERASRLIEVGDRLWEKHLDAQIGKTLSCVTLQRSKDDEATDALSDNYCPVRIDELLPPNQAVDVRIAARDGKILKTSQF